MKQSATKHVSASLEIVSLAVLILVMPVQVFGFYPFTFPNYMMVGRVIKPFSVHVNRLSCLRECHMNEQCLSYNFEPSTEGKGLCELNKCGVKDDHERGKSLIYREGVFFQQIRPSNERGEKRLECWPKPIDGNWIAWSDWVKCSVTCGEGVQSRNRTCANPPPAHGGKKCDGSSNESRSCGEVKCPADGKWTAWSQWTSCSVTCGGGMHLRNRTCTNPPLAQREKACNGSSNETRGCGNVKCPVDGNWTAWSEWTNCSVTCGGGVQSRNRTCANPPPAHGGKKCDGSSNESRSCGEVKCPADRKWTAWSQWTSCSVTCGGGMHLRNRTCTNPPLAQREKACNGSSNETRGCGNVKCPVDGNWTAWSEWTNCSVTCGGGVQSRNRTCTNPPPAHSGKECNGKSNQTQSCGATECPDCTRISLGAARGGRLNDSSFSASSYRGGNLPKDARLNNSKNFWCPASPIPTGNPSGYLQVDLREIFLICAVATQGNPMDEWWTTEYKLLTSLECSKWNVYKSEGGSEVFKGNKDGGTVEKITLPKPIKGRCVRFIPTKCNDDGYPCMRVDLYGRRPLK